MSHSSVIEYHQQKLEILAKDYGHEITLVTPPWWMEGGVRAEAFTGGSIKYRIGKTFVFKKRAFHFYFDAGRIIKEENPDIVHVEEEPFTFACFQFLSAAKKRGKKTVFFTWENIRRRHNPGYEFFNNYCIKNTDAAIAGNNEGRDILVEKGCRAPVYVIPQYGINMKDFILRGGDAPKRDYKIGYVGRILPEKGIEVLIDALSGIPDARLVMAGTGASGYTALVREAAEKKLAGRHEFTGFVEREKMGRLLASLDILVLPSLTTKTWKEQFGRVIAEAFASGVPVIGSGSGEIPNVIGDAGLVFKEGSSADLAGKIMHLMADGELYKSCAEKGTKRVLEHYTNEGIAAKLDFVYRALLKR